MSVTVKEKVEERQRGLLKALSAGEAKYRQEVLTEKLRRVGCKEPSKLQVGFAAPTDG